MKFSRFAENFNAHSGILQLMSDLEARDKSGHSVHMLGGGNPACIAEMEQVFRQQMIGLLNSDRDFEEMLGRYDAPQGNPAFISLLVDLLNQTYNWGISSKNIAITNGSQSSFGLLFNLFSGEFSDDVFKHILLPLIPEYIGYNDVGLGSRNIFVSNQPLIELNVEDDLLFKYRVDFDRLKVDDNIGAICISRPTNPTGNVVSDEELEKLIDLSNEHRIPLIIDGAYGQPFPGIIFTDATLPRWQKNLIFCLSLSKLGLPGVRTGIVIADEEVIEMIKGANAIHSLAPSAFGPTLTRSLMSDGVLLDACEKYITPFYRNRVTLVVELIRQLFSGLPIRIHQPEGAIFLWLWFDGLPVSSTVLYKRLKSLGVFVIDGQHFFPGLNEDWQHQFQCIRVSYAADWKIVEQGLKIVSEQVRNIYDNSNC